MTCLEPGCTQPTFGKGRCYFHRKQHEGLIPVEDREFYLQKQDFNNLSKDHSHPVDLFYKYLPMINRVGVSIINGMALRMPVKDAMQELYIAWWNSCQSGGKVERYESYIVSLLKNTAVSLFRKERNCIEFDDRDVEECCKESECGTDEVCILQKQLRKVNKSLTTLDRYLLRNYLLSEKRTTLEDLGRRFGLSKVAVYNRVMKIKNKIKQLMEQNNGN